ncbi:NADH dehydrogenase [ubiquinone] 1 beta subcomplex subunit 9 [Cyphellophora attinorum]|uniref:NADH dehydrogenase [ubiquinone] 1 beta subcomplex subunit 9 n=1 Tax=Cyphellophora attinorum TaxID=1664694 RepID=A0A0N1HL73_9EURO|nr:NADH dehydrogenase [ubiquinone] 1 beta subcomplex subunit 9 [Phialophora attinorum]KPI35203.1 NADH dehydrogenase [ubiquinone] 1 beta subcomplex subunit 9 [Phialophora attinorum]
MSQVTPHVKAVRSLYRKSLKLALDWAVQRNLWRGQAVYIRSLFDANRNINDPRQRRILFVETEKLLEKWKHPDPYRPPSAPGGSKYERNLPPPDLPPPDREITKEL